MMNGLGHDVGRTAIHLTRISPFAKTPEHFAVLRLTFGRKAGDHTFHIAERFIDRWCVNGSGLDDRNTDSERPQFEPKRFTEHPECAFAGVEKASEWNRDMSSNGGDVYDASTRAAEQRKKRLRDGDLPENVDVEDFLQIGGAGILDRTHHSDTRDIHQGIESPALELIGNQFG